MTQLANTFEGGSAGATITTANSGGTSGNAFDGVGIPTGAVVQFSSTAFEGTVGMQAAQRGTVGATGVNWQSSFGSQADFFGRFFFRTDTIPSLNDIIFYMLDPTLATQIGYIRFLASGSIDLKNTADGTVATSSTTFSTNTWYRIEYQAHVNSTAGYVTVWIYTDPTAAIGGFAEVLNASGATTWAMGVSNCGYVSHQAGGSNANWPSTTGLVYFDGIVTGAASQVGPLATSNPPPALIMAPMIPAYSRS